MAVTVVTGMAVALKRTYSISAFCIVVTCIGALSTFVDVIAGPGGVVPIGPLVIKVVPFVAYTGMCADCIFTRNRVAWTGVVGGYGVPAETFVNVAGVDSTGVGTGAVGFGEACSVGASGFGVDAVVAVEKGVASGGGVEGGGGQGIAHDVTCGVIAKFDLCFM